MDAEGRATQEAKAEDTEMIMSAEVQAVLFEFAQLALKKRVKILGRISLDLSIENEMFKRLSNSQLTVKDVKAMTKREQKFIMELISQYITYTGLFDDLEFPDNFLDGCSFGLLGQTLLDYIVEHRWPFPQQLPH